MRTFNPFLISGYLGPEYFCDRETETDTIIDALQNGRNLTLISPRRMGKTGLIHHAFTRLREMSDENLTFYLDIYSTQNFNDFVRLFAASIIGQLDSAPHKALVKLGNLFRSFRPVISFDDLTGLPQVSVDVAPTTEETSLKEIFQYLASSKKICYIAIDEFQQVTEYPENGIEALLRSYIQFLPNVNFIFAGSKKHVIQEMFTSSKKPFFQSTQMMTLDAIDREKYYAFAYSHFAEAGMNLPEDVFMYLYDRYDGHTWYIQSILNRLYGYRDDVCRDNVQVVINQIVAEYSYTYADLMRAYTDSNVRLLRAVARENCVKEITSSAFISRYNLKAASSVNTSLKKLLDNELIYLTPKGYIIYDRFMNDWLRSQPF